MQDKKMTSLFSTPSHGWEGWVEISAQVWGKDENFRKLVGKDELSHNIVVQAYWLFFLNMSPTVVFTPSPLRSSYNHRAGLVDDIASPSDLSFTTRESPKMCI